MMKIVLEFNSIEEYEKEMSEKFGTVRADKGFPVYSDNGTRYDSVSDLLDAINTSDEYLANLIEEKGRDTICGSVPTIEEEPVRRVAKVKDTGPWKQATVEDALLAMSLTGVKSLKGSAKVLGVSESGWRKVVVTGDLPGKKLSKIILDYIRRKGVRR